MGALVFSQKIAAFMTFAILYRQKTAVEHKQQYPHRQSEPGLDAFTAPGKKKA